MNSNEILAVSGLAKSYGSLRIINNLSLGIKRGERHALIGPNGAGKSTLIGLLSGNLAPTLGDIRFNGRNIIGMKPHQRTRLGIARSFQITNIFRDASVLDNVKIAIVAHRRMLRDLLRPWSSLRELDAEAMNLVNAVGLSSSANEPADILSYSSQRALEIAVALAADPQLLILDEPMAGMSRAETEQMMTLLRNVTIGRTLLMVEHDMNVVFNLSDRISVLVYGNILATGTPDEIRSNDAVQTAYLGSVPT